MNERTDLIIGEKNREQINNSLIVLAGLGGVGGTSLEIFIRFGFKNFILIDCDTFEESNLNRQLLSSLQDIGKYKTEVAEKRIKQINTDTKVKLLNNKIEFNDDYISFLCTVITEFKNSSCLKNIIVADAIDDVLGKCALYRASHLLNAPVYSSMGAGRTLFSNITTKPLLESYSCPLARATREACRKNLKEDEYKSVKALFCPIPTDIKQISNIIPSSVTQTFNMGLYLATTVIKELLEH